MSGHAELGVAGHQAVPEHAALRRPPRLLRWLSRVERVTAGGARREGTVS